MHHSTQAGKSATQIRHSCSDPDLRAHRKPDHPSKYSSTVRSASAATCPVTRRCPFASWISIVPEVHRAATPRTCPDLFVGHSEIVTGRRLLDETLPSRPSRYFLRQSTTWLALTACRRATRATDAPAANVSSTIRRFSSTERRCLFTCLAVSIATCSEVSIYPLVDTYRWCPQRAASLFITLTLSRRWSPVAYVECTTGIAGEFVLLTLFCVIKSG